MCYVRYLHKLPFKNGNCDQKHLILQLICEFFKMLLI